MSNKANHKNLQNLLNRMAPVADDVKLGDLLQELVDSNNDLKTQVITLTAKLDADAGITDVNYAATIVPAAALADINDRG